MGWAAGLAAVLLAGELPPTARLPAAGYVSVPVVQTPGVHGWYATVTVNGRPALAALDTGAGTSAVDRSRVAALGGVGAPIASLPAVRFGPLTVARLAAEAIDLNADNHRPNGSRRHDLLLGNDVFGPARAVFDFAARTLHLRPDGPPGLPPVVDALLRRDGLVPTPVVVSPVTGSRYVRADLGRRSAWLVVDSGAARDTLFHDAARLLDLHPDDDPWGKQPIIGGMVRAYRPVRTDLRVGDGPLRPRHAFNVMDRPAGWDVREADGLRFDGVLGLATLRAARAVYDVAGRTLWLGAAAGRPATLTDGHWRATKGPDTGYCGRVLGERLTVADGQVRVTVPSRRVLTIGPDPLGRPGCLTLVCPILGTLGARVERTGDVLTVWVGRHPATEAAAGPDGLTAFTLRPVAAE